MPSPSAMPSSGQDSALNLAGSYAVQGTSPDGSAYEGSVVISGDEASGFQVQWTIGPDQYTGTGTLAGKTLTVDWGAPEPIVYKIKKERSGGLKLDGRWGKKGRGREKLSKLPS